MLCKRSDVSRISTHSLCLFKGKTTSSRPPASLRGQFLPGSARHQARSLAKKPSSPSRWPGEGQSSPNPSLGSCQPGERGIWQTGHTHQLLGPMMHQEWWGQRQLPVDTEYCQLEGTVFWPCPFEMRLRQQWPSCSVENPGRGIRKPGFKIQF